MFGFLNLHKPAGMTSRDVVNVVQRLVRPEKVGHAGTLDPLATGVLVVGVGYATRLFPYLQQLPKTYRATFQFGLRSDTEDMEGQVEAVPSEPISREQLERELMRWRGEVQQVPPVYSAAKVAGKRAYELARRGQPPLLEARTITIHTLEIEDFGYPFWTLQMDCSSGTYVRSLGRDIAHGLGTSAVMTQLERTAIGPFRLYDAVPLEQINSATVAQYLLSPEKALPHHPKVGLTPAQVRDVVQGRTIPLEGVEGGITQLAALDERQALVAILVRVGSHQWRAERCFSR